jgi:hypothetical protein
MQKVAPLQVAAPDGAGRDVKALGRLVDAEVEVGQREILRARPIKPYGRGDLSGAAALDTSGYGKMGLGLFSYQRKRRKQRHDAAYSSNQGNLT